MQDYIQLAVIIHTGAPITVANDAIEMLTVATDKTITEKCSLFLLSIYQNTQKNQYIY